MRRNLQANGSQQRALVVDELLSETATAVYALLVADLAHAHQRFIVEKDEEAAMLGWSQVAAKRTSGQVCNRYSRTTQRHGQAGIVCKPFSAGNAQRRQPGRVESQPDVGIGAQVVKYS